MGELLGVREHAIKLRLHLFLPSLLLLESLLLLFCFLQLTFFGFLALSLFFSLLLGLLEDLVFKGFQPSLEVSTMSRDLC